MKEETIPILMLTHNRLPYSVHTFPCLLSDYSGVPTKITIVDNNSTDGTQVWLKNLLHSDIEEVIFSPENMGLARPMNEFFRKHRDYKFVAKVDNDTILPRLWLAKLVDSMEKGKETLGRTGAISGWCLRPGGMTAENWYRSMVAYELSDGTKMKRNSYICGTGVLINMDLIRTIGLLSESEPCLLGGWTAYCRIVSEILGGFNFYFNMSVFINLLNLAGDHKLSGDLPEYDEELRDMRNEGNRWWEAQGGLPGVYKFILNNGGFRNIETP